MIARALQAAAAASSLLAGIPAEAAPGAPPLAAAASPASLGLPGSWVVTGQVAAFSFTVECRFAPSGEALQGACVDVSTNDPKVKAGAAHPLTAGRIAGDQVSWTYRSHFLIYPFDVVYQGRVLGDEIAGTVAAAGRSGRFTAVRLKGPATAAGSGGGGF